MDSDRREFLKQSAELFAIATFLHFGFVARAWSKPIAPLMNRWFKEVTDLCHSVKNGKVSPIEWQDTIQILYSQIPLFEIVRYTNVDQVIKTVKYPKEKLGAIHDVPWPEIQGFPKVQPFGHKLFVYKKGSCTPPHAHNHLVSAHLVLKGSIHARTYDRIKDLEKAILINPVKDVVVNSGAVISMSDARENVHWFEGVSDVSVSFDIPVPGIEPKKQYAIPEEAYNQIYLDPTVKPNLSGKIEAPVIKFEDSVKKFG